MAIESPDCRYFGVFNFISTEGIASSGCCAKVMKFTAAKSKSTTYCFLKKGIRFLWVNVHDFFYLKIHRNYID